MTPDYVLKFSDNRHTTLWGVERWGLSAHAADPSRVVNGPLAGRLLSEVMRGFPLLVKTIDARARLSVQVHPDSAAARATGGEPKSEMWCLLTDGPIYAGFRAGVTAADVSAAVGRGNFDELLIRHDGRRGDVFFIPGGLVHTIGAGMTVYEVQQSSVTTFRLYDWDRVGPDGRPRPLHVDRALQAINYSLPPPAASRTCSCALFDFRQIALDGRQLLAPSAAGLILFAAAGEVTADGTALAAGESALVPPGRACLLSGRAHVLLTTLHG
jgi:mannose-6-phosphate isomerase